LGGDTVAILLTGMGNDGTAGLGPLKRAGGYVIAQDEETSVVWGMPGSAVEAGLVDAVLPLAEIAPAVQTLVSG
jgi:two-component system chemotaxis response regulator CheB